MRALPDILKVRPQARVVIIGDNQVSYGAAPQPGPDGKPPTWREILLNEVKGELDLSSVHFAGKMPYADFLRVLQVSTVHVWLTYPFVLSRSLPEAMSAGCANLANDTAPVREAIRQGETTQLVDFFDPTVLARLGAQARAFVVANYDLQTRCLPELMDWIHRLAENFAS